MDRNNLSSIYGMKMEEMSMINPNSFPSKLWQLVNDPGIGSICWDDSGTVIMIHQQQFVAEVLLYQAKRMNEYFKTKDFTSIVRQLNLYGFRKMHLNPDASEQQLACSSVRLKLHHFHNPNFKRDKPELLVNLKRLTLTNKAKLASGKQSNSSLSLGVHRVMLKSPQKKNSALMKQGSLSQHDFKGSEQVTQCARTPQSFQALVHDDLSLRILYANNFDSPCAHPSSPVHVPQGVIMPHHLQHRFYTQVYQSCTPGFLDSNMPYFPQLAASYPSFDSYSDYTVSYLHRADQTPGWKTGAIPDNRMRDMRMNMDPVFKQGGLMQAPAEVRKVAGAKKTS